MEDRKLGTWTTLGEVLAKVLADARELQVSGDRKIGGGARLDEPGVNANSTPTADGKPQPGQQMAAAAQRREDRAPRVKRTAIRVPTPDEVCDFAKRDDSWSSDEQAGYQRECKRYSPPARRAGSHSHAAHAAME